MRIGFIVIAHEAPGPLVELAQCLTSEGDSAVIHYDLRSSGEHFGALERAFSADRNILLAQRVACGWGEYSLVEATLNGLKTLVGSGKEFDYVYLMSGADLPLKPIATLRAFLGHHLGKKTEFIQSFPMKDRKWIVAGLEKERFIYRHFFNERRHPVYFKMSLQTQRFLGIKRKPPSQVDICLGSQWWCLRWETCIAMLNFIENNPEVDRFFRTTWIPDESYFQTIVRQVVPADKISNYSLTYFQFNDYGKPVVYFDEHFDFLRRQNFFFGRKTAASAARLRKRLLEVGSSGVVENINEGQIGDYTLEYHAQRALRRDPSPLFRSKGRPYNPPAADLPFLPRNILAVLTASSSIKLLTGWASPVRTTLVHGDLFDEHRIRFAEENWVFGGYRETDIGERNATPLAFLSNVIAAGPETTGFCININAERQLSVARDLTRLPNAAVLALVPGSLLDATLAEIDKHFLCFDSSRHLTSSDIMGCISTALLSAKKLRKAVDQLSRRVTVWFSNGGTPAQTVVNPQLAVPDALSEAAQFILQSQIAWSFSMNSHPLRGHVADVIRHYGADHHWSGALIVPKEHHPLMRSKSTVLREGNGSSSKQAGRNRHRRQ